jgi:hypothetical protein
LGKFTLPYSKEYAIRFRLMKQMPPSPAQSLLPGLAAAALIGLVVQENTRTPVPDASFGDRLRVMPKSYRQFLLAVGIFGAGAFAHTLLILLAMQRLTPRLGAVGATSAAVALYVLHNVFYASFSYASGLLADRFPKNWLLAAGYALATLMALEHYVLADKP